MARLADPAGTGKFPSLDWSDIAPSVTRQSRSAIEQVMETLDGQRAHARTVLRSWPTLTATTSSAYSWPPTRCAVS